MKTCSVCGIDKGVEEFSHKNSSKDGYASECKQCIHKRTVAYYKTHKINIISYKDKRIKINYNVKFCKLFTQRLKRFIKNSTENKSICTIIGCSIKHLRLHLEDNFQDGMTWDNYGLRGWVIDHKIPTSVFNLQDFNQVIICFNWKNMQPLWELDNKKKGNSLYWNRN